MKSSIPTPLKTILIVTLVNLSLTNTLIAKISTTDQCAAALQLMNIDTRGTNRGYAALCAGVVEWEPLARYGNWYGPGYWGGDTKIHKAGLKAPVDSLDEIAMHHDFGYVIAEKYGKIYGKQYEFKLKAIADKIAVRDSMNLPKDPSKWDKVPADIEAASRYRDRMTTGFILESELYKKLGDATKVGDAVTSPFITWFDKIDYEHIPDMDKFEREVESHINGWKKEVATEEKKEKEAKKIAEALEEKKLQAQTQKEKVEKENVAKKEKDAEEARKRLKQKIEESKKEELNTKKKTYEEMSPEERREALKNNDEEAWDAIKKELIDDTKSNTEVQQEEISKQSDEMSKDIPPIHLTAASSYEEDYSFGEFKNIVTTTITASFWNVGSQVSGYGGATIKNKSVSSLNGSTSESKCTGTFSGGPNGVIHLYGECSGMSLNLKNGQSLNIDGMSLKVSDPSAFKYWEK